MIKIKVETDPELNPPNDKTVSIIITQLFESKGIHNGDLLFIFGNDELLNSLKKEFFNQNHFTDVIAFRINDYAQENVEGEVYISLPRVEENAKKFNQPFHKELGRLIIHGGLHLLGYEDKTDEEKAEMTRQENQYLDQVNWNQLYG